MHRKVLEMLHLVATDGALVRDDWRESRRPLSVGTYDPFR